MKIIKKNTHIWICITTILLFYILLMFNGCIIIKEKDEIIRKETISEYVVAPKTTSKMSNNFIRSSKGDMMVSIPEGWYFIEPEGSVSSEIFSITISPDYTISAIFSHIKKTIELDDIVEKEGILGLATTRFLQKKNKSQDGVKLIENYEIQNVQSQQFGIFNFIKIKDNTFGKTATFISSLGEYYEFSLVSMNFTSNDLPNRDVFDKIFMSILLTLKY